MENNNLQNPSPQPQMKPDNNLVWAILTTILCCLPFGIVAIVYAAKVDGLWYAGMYDAARDAAKKAGIWSIVAAAASALFVIIYLGIVFLFVGASASGFILDDLFY